MRSNVVHHSEGVGQRYSHHIGHGSDRCDAIAGKTKSYGHRESAIAACQPSNKLGVWSRSVGESVYLIRHTGRAYGTDTSRQRRDHARHPSCDTAIEGSAQRTRRPARAEPEDRCQVAQAGFCAWRTDGAEESSFDGTDGRGGSRCRSLPQAHALAAG